MKSFITPTFCSFWPDVELILPTWLPSLRWRRERNTCGAVWNACKRSGPVTGFTVLGADNLQLVWAVSLLVVVLTTSFLRLNVTQQQREARWLINGVIISAS